MICDRCGATIEESAFCKYCGARVLRPDAAAQASATDPARFDLAHASPGFLQALDHVPRAQVAVNVLAPIVMMVFVAGFVAIAASATDGHEPRAFQAMFFAVPALMFGVCIYLLIRGIRYARAPLLRAIAVVIEERTEVSGGGSSRSVSTRYFATLQAKAGDRIEYGTAGWLAGRIAPGDIGVAFTKRDQLIDFLRLEA